MIDYEILKEAWIKQGYDLSSISPKDLDKRKTINGKFYSIIPSIGYKEWKDKFFAHFDMEELLSLKINNAPSGGKNFLINHADLIPYMQNFASEMTADNVKNILEKILGTKVDAPPENFRPPGPEQWVKATSAAGIMTYIADDIASSEVGIFECDPIQASLFALYIVDLKHERRCPIKKCTHGRKCIIESKTYGAEKTIIYENNKGVKKEYLLRAKECKNTRQPYMVINDYNTSVIFDYLFQLKEEKCPLCDSGNNRQTTKNNFFIVFKCLQCGNEFKVYNGNYYYNDFPRNIDDRLGILHIDYLMGCKILGLTPELFKKYKEICCHADKKELMAFFKDINISDKKGLSSFLYKEIKRVARIMLDRDDRSFFEEYDSIIKKMGNQN